MDTKLPMFRNRLEKVYRHVGKMARRQGITCFRIYDHDLPEFPLCIERYEDELYVAEYKRRHGMDEEQHEQWLDDCLQVMEDVIGVRDEQVHIKQRQRKPGRQGQYQKTSGQQQVFVVREAGLQFEVNLSDYLDTGLFLDHRITRGLVREQSSGKKVLNLFAYTGSFSVYAAAGGAAEVHTVDMSNTYLQWARRNLSLNDFSDESRYPVIQADVLQWLPKQRKDSYDLIVMDPPTFSNSKRMKDFLDIQRDHVSLLNQALDCLRPAGILYFSTNFSRFQLDEPAIQASLIQDITRLTTPFDFQGKLKRYCWRMTK